ncbi:hypothetical protein BN7_6142 [Wickerhamomyces ciferrii]|uniref:Reverse transcriptase zinc-binding domain-containing protein n=1 Tax=Wickerhamomyces ciferrii (strain ATCC 14091 / BCRC 22168 / CBS 111 / JCM 3599 / NBRC 0793 / NRRL Y-1031 F-60-10) TaxID=1206466 RepID=K0KYR2_WICCF|nr:uncharacterized protein BN7_6142 [Wickerhamomyces ciferrii]CCH46549.1 hypothetical protein BN7_6142 [Wickerhamomyces ciferrii]
MGGFGLMNLRHQLNGRRAKFIYYLFQDRNQWHSQYLVEKIQFYITQIIDHLQLVPTEMIRETFFSHTVNGITAFYPRTQDENKQISFPWWQILDGTFTKWLMKNKDSNNRIQALNLPNLEKDEVLDTWQLISHIIPSKNDELNLGNFFNNMEKHWIQSWFEVLTVKDNEYDKVDFQIMNKHQIYTQQIKRIDKAKEALLKNMQDVEGEKIQLESFKHYNKKKYRESGNFIMRPSLQIIVDNTNRNIKSNWKNMWIKLYMNQKKNPGILEWLHRFILGHLTVRRCVRLKPQYPNRLDPKCCLCLKEEEDTTHIYTKCEVSKEIWKLISESQTELPSIEEFYMPISNKPEELLDKSRFIEFIYLMRGKRRYSTEKIEGEITGEFLEHYKTRFMMKKKRLRKYY